MRVNFFATVLDKTFICFNYLSGRIWQVEQCSYLPTCPLNGTRKTKKRAKYESDKGNNSSNSKTLFHFSSVKICQFSFQMSNGLTPNDVIENK